MEIEDDSDLDDSDLNQHHLKTRPAHRNMATSQTSEVVGMAQKNCNSYPDVIFKRHH